MHIAVCDDNPQDLKQIACLIERHAAAASVSVTLQCFSSAEDMLKKARSERFTHYFLDVIMPAMDGITAAQEIRSFDADAKIIFLTSFTEYAYQSYRVKAYDYLLKPVTDDTLAPLLSQLNAQESASQECICIQSGRSFYRIPFAKLSYLEINQKKLHFYLTDGQVRQIPGSMAEFEKTLLVRPEFVKIHRSYIVNLRQVSAITPDGCIMFSGTNLPVSRLLYQRVQSRFMEHLFSAAEV